MLLSPPDKLIATITLNIKKVLKQRYIFLLIIVLAQFSCTSLWFASNGILDDLIMRFGLDQSSIGSLTSSVQLGFITGTLIFAVLSLVDKVSPSKIFLICALAGAVCNAGMLWNANTLWTLIMIRFLTGICLAGIYPVGMKIAADHYDKELGKSMGFLVGALVVGTAFPHLLRGGLLQMLADSVIICTSVLAAIGGIVVYLVIPDGPYRKAGTQVKLLAFTKLFKNRSFRSSAMGYFGHMWELYAFWVFVPIALQSYSSIHHVEINTSLYSFVVIAAGGPSCVVAGILARRLGTRKIAVVALILSGVCCILSPLFFMQDQEYVFLAFLLIWGMVVVADSPMLSTLVANSADPMFRGTALTVVTCIGFSITILSILLLTYLSSIIEFRYVLVVLAIGPLVGLSNLLNSSAKTSTTEN